MNLCIIKTRLTRMLKKGTMSPMLHDALVAAIEALNNNDLKLAYQITACKSYIVGKIDPKDTRDSFQEDETANKRSLGDSIYSLLDGVHFEISMAAQELPSGMSHLSATGITAMKHKGTHPIVQRIIHEDRVINEEANQRRIAHA